MKMTMDGGPDSKRRRRDEGSYMPFNPDLTITPPEKSISMSPSTSSLPSQPRTPSRQGSDWYRRRSEHHDDDRSRSSRRHPIRDLLDGPADRSQASGDPDEKDMDRPDIRPGQPLPPRRVPLPQVEGVGIPGIVGIGTVEPISDDIFRPFDPTDVEAATPTPPLPQLTPPPQSIPPPTGYE